MLYTDLRPVHEQQPHQRLRTRCAAAMVDNTNARTLPMVNEAPVCMLILVALVFFFEPLQCGVICVVRVKECPFVLCELILKVRYNVGFHKPVGGNTLSRAIPTK